MWWPNNHYLWKWGQCLWRKLAYQTSMHFNCISNENWSAKWRCMLNVSYWCWDNYQSEITAKIVLWEKWIFEFTLSCSSLQSSLKKFQAIFNLCNGTGNWWECYTGTDFSAPPFVRRWASGLCYFYICAHLQIFARHFLCYCCCFHIVSSSSSS